VDAQVSQTDTEGRRIAEEYEWEIDELAVQVDHVPVFVQVAPR
jgi:REP element-mobilizing transposase RayT